MSHVLVLTTENEELETFLSQERLNDNLQHHKLRQHHTSMMSYRKILSKIFFDLNFEEPDIMTWNGELNSNQTTQLQLPEKTQEDAVIENLLQWASSTQVPYIHVSSLLKVLHKNAALTYLPLYSRTLLKSLRGKLLFEDMPPGKYRHFDLEASLVRFIVALQSKGIQIPSEIKLLFNADGLPLSKSCSNEFWPILVRIQVYDYFFAAGIYQGRGKPADVNVYLKFFAADIHHLKISGLQFEGQKINVSVCGMSSDAPAMAYILNIKGHNAFYGCRICTTRELSSGLEEVTFPEINAPLRSDSSFRKRENIQHHNNNQIRSVVENIIDDLTADVHLDYMHLVCIGCFQKILNVFFCHPFDNIRLSPAASLAISAFREHVCQYIPISDFAKKA
uniref:Uncharacterized protein n=1 Tax=Daphnia galeata TaxID=27404 RepID=A0A8J2RDU7_9CRUS|nr:unnamed protein product [Daphnia galeata]